MRKKKFLKAAVALVLALALLSGSALAATRSAKVFSSMAVYKSKGRGRVGTLARGASIKVKGVSGGWAKISYKGKTVYAKLKNIEFNSHVKAVTTESSSIKFITKSSSGKRTYYTGTLAAGITIYLAGVRGSKYLFYSEDGSAMGFISKSAVRKAS